METPDWIRTYTMHSTKTGLIAAMSDDLPGLLVVGHTMEEVERLLPAAIADLVERGGAISEGAVSYPIADSGAPRSTYRVPPEAPQAVKVRPIGEGGSSDKPPPSSES